jgi:hypothetical protein
MPQTSEAVTNVTVAPATKLRPRPRGRNKPHRAADAQLRERVEQIRQQVFRTVCSATWADDCLYRGARYAPDFRCRCALCREKFPDRLHPREARQSDFSGDCQMESEHDPELAEDLDRLRNDRDRVGSVFIVRDSDDRGRGASRRARSG